MAGFLHWGVAEIVFVSHLNNETPGLLGLFLSHHTRLSLFSRPAAAREADY